MLRLLIWQVFGVRTFLPEAEKELYAVFGSNSRFKPPKIYSPTFVKTHKPPPDDKPAIFIVRDGRDAIVSFYHYIHKVTHNPACMAQVIYDSAPVDTPQPGNWSQYFHAWKPLTRPDCILVKYEEMLEEPDSVIDKISRAFDLKPERRFVNNFQALHASFSGGFRTGKSGGWRGELVGTDLKFFWQIHGDVMRQLGYGEGEVS